MDRIIQEDQGGYWSFPLANGELAEKGKIVCIDTANAGVIVMGKAGAGLVPIGISNSSGWTGNGVRKIHVKMFHEISGYWWNNDPTEVDAVVAADRGSIVYIKDSQTVSTNGTGRSPAGMVLDVSPVDGVFVVMGYRTTPDAA